MKTIKTIKTIMTVLALSLSAAQGGCKTTPADSTALSSPTVTYEDFQGMEGKWTGTLTYLDYTSEKLVSIPVAAEIEPPNSRTVRYSISYPDEPWENTKAKIRLSKDGRSVDKNAIKSKNVTSDGLTVFTTEHLGEDNREPALIRKTYTIGSKVFSIKKDVRSLEGDAFVNRNIYAFKR